MTLTPEQFNKLVTKEEFNEFKSEMLELKDDVKEILTVVDGIAKSLADAKEDRVTNIAAHDRFEVRITELEKKIN